MTTEFAGTPDLLAPECAVGQNAHDSDRGLIDEGERLGIQFRLVNVDACMGDMSG